MKTQRTDYTVLEFVSIDRDIHTAITSTGERVYQFRRALYQPIGSSILFSTTEGSSVNR